METKEKPGKAMSGNYRECERGLRNRKFSGLSWKIFLFNSIIEVYRCERLSSREEVNYCASQRRNSQHCTGNGELPIHSAMP